MKTKSFAVIAAIAILAMVGGLVLADDGAMFRRNISKTPDQETERANLMHMTFYVPAQNSAGELITIEYIDGAGTVLTETRDFAKPLVAVYIDALPEEEHEEEEGIYEILSGAGFGAHDAYAALSLDDGNTWKRTNLSMSADLSSFTLANGHEYPGDAHNMTFAIAGDKVLVGWISKYCDGGSPAYTWLDEEDNDLYPDIWGVAGSQSSIDFTGLGFPEVGEVPYSCVWAARGTLITTTLDSESTGYDIIWTKAERLTSGRRDANRLEMNGDSAAGFMMTWQEDPEGLRPGQGLGPGEGWSGAVVNQQTDLWYSAISMDDFVMVQTSDDDETPVSIYDYASDTLPKVAAPMALPIRLTDNKMCKATGSDPYCYIDFDNVDADGNLILPDNLPTAPTADSDYCATQVSWLNPGGTTLNLCVAEDGRVLMGRVGASRPRVNVQPYDSDGDGVYDSAWVIMGAEESKALGEGTIEEEVEPEDLGKNMWYYSFDMLNPGVVLQGGMLNQPAIDPETEDFFELLEDDFGNPFYETEISRRFAHFSQPIHQIGEKGVSAVLIVKQGILNQGGPADIFLRRTVVPDEDWIGCPEASPYEQCLPAGYNPYAYENMFCEDAEGNSQWAFTDESNGGSNPRYLQGLCLSDMINVSGGSIVSCDNGTSGDDCAAAFPWDGKDDIGDDDFPKVTEWVQTAENLDDQSWENPYDVSKGHRGFIDGDFIMMMYAWSPNWQANSVGNDHYNLYARRSFDGGLTWTTTPAALGGVGTVTCENFKDQEPACTTYGAGEFEQARNLSQLIGNKVTILDPRYTPTGGIKMLPITDLKEIGFAGYDDDIRDPSKFFIVYETGDNTTVAEGEAIPMDLFYSRATNWGDDYDVVEYNNPDDPDNPILGFDWLEHDREDLSGEAANLANNGGNFYYVIWNQWNEDEYENVSNSDAIFRRIMYLEDTEALPTSSILYVSHTEVAYDEPVEITFVGTGKDNDRMGEGEEITDFEWTSDLDGFLSDQKSFSVNVAALSLGTHNIYFRVKDNEGNWSGAASTRIRVAEAMSEFEQHTIYLPLVVNQ